MNKMILIGLAAVGGYLIYQKMTEGQTGSYDVTPYADPNQQYNQMLLGQQPSQLYPYVGINPPRVDNSSQPWFIGDRGFNQDSSKNLVSGLDMNFAKNVQYVQGAADIAGSLNDLWNNLGSFFTDETSYDA